ncbi:HAMP domain-containing sensor histidine kinase [Dongia sp. agr-C8]
MMPKSDLKVRLTLRIAAIAALCFAAGAAYLLLDADRAARGRLDRAARLAASSLELQQSKLEWVQVQMTPFPDLQATAAVVMEPGLCIAYRPAGGDMLQRICGGTEAGPAGIPASFATLYRALFGPVWEVSKPVQAHQQVIGETVAWLDDATIVAQVWHGLWPFLAVMLATLLLLCALVYAALARALRPTRLIRTGLERIAANDLSTRLPPFDLAELSAVRTVFNRLAEDLQRTVAERNALTHRLISVQDEERKRLARELHDEFGQNLTAIRALAASAGQSAECDSISRISTTMMESLRGTLFRLRPPDVEELGLTASLEGLVSGWNGRSRGRPRFEIALEGPLDQLPVSIGVDLYRIAQEAITNAAKHADANLVTLRLALRGGEVELRVENDGPAHDVAGARPGMGLLGMRERVAILGGRLSITSDAAGTILCATIPIDAVANIAERAA